MADVAQDIIEEAEAQARLEAELEDWDKKFEEDWELEIDEEMSKKASDQHETD